MSRHAQLPPRCPLQKKITSLNPSFCPSREYIEFRNRQGGPHKSISQSSVLEEQPPPWLNDLLNDSDSNVNRTSDHLSPFNRVVPLQLDLGQFNETEEAEENSCEPDDDDGLESSCTYGPNSPRRKNKLGYPEKEIVSAFSDYVMQTPLQQHLQNGYVSVSGVVPHESDSFVDACAASMGDSNTDSISMKRHPGQRSRIRKLQYIAELERSVDILQNVGSELGIRVASLLQQYTALSLENNTLKQQMLRMQHQKYIVNDEYSSLRKEVEMLKIGLTVPSANNKVHKRSLSAADIAHSDALWNMIDFRKLDLN